MYVIHTAGRDRVIATADIRAMLLNDDSFTPAVDDDHPNDLTAHELAGSGYGRETLAGVTRTVNTTLDRIEYGWDAPDFGTIVAGETALWLSLFEWVTSNSDSLLIATIKLGNGVATDGTPMIIPQPVGNVWFFLPGGTVA